MGVRSGRLKPLVLRLGLVLGAAACAWIGYEAGDDHAARAADRPPVATVDAVVGGVTGLLQATLPPVGLPPSAATDTPDPPRRAGSGDDGGDTGGTPPSRAGSSPATDTRHATPPPKRRTAAPADRPTRAVPPRPGTPETVAPRTSRPPRDRVAAPPTNAVDRVATPVVGALPAVPDPVAGPVLGTLPPVVDPIAGPIVGGRGPVVDPLLRGLHPVLRPLKPVLHPLKPVLHPLKPVLHPLEPVLRPLDPVLGALRPAEVAPPAERVPGAGATAEQAPRAADTVGRPPGAATTAPPTPSATARPTGQLRIEGTLAGPARTKAAAWSPAEAGTGPLHHPVRPDLIPHRGAPATDTGGVGSAGGVHQPVADASTVAWMPPATGLRLCRPDGPAPLGSRCPRPGSRPA